MNRVQWVCMIACMAVFGMTAATTAQGAKPGPADLAMVGERIYDAVKRPINSEQAVRLLAAMKPDGTFPDVPYDDTGPGNWRAASHLSHVLTLARWYSSLGPDAPEKNRARDAVFRGIDFWNGKDYRNSNWWWNVIGVPGTLSQIYILMDKEIEGSRRDKGLEIIARGKLSMTGANLADVVSISIRRGILEKNVDLVSQAVGMMADEIKITLDEGIQPDFSFYQHGALPYNHGYGAVFLSNCSELANVVRGTAFEFPPEKIELLSRLIIDGNQWMIRCGTKDYGATGRGITRRAGDSSSAGYLAPVVRDMLMLGTGHDPEFRNILARLGGDSSAPLVGNRHFWRGDLMTHHRPGYYMSAKMVSNRIFNTDGPSNEEGLKSHHLSDGCTYIMRTGMEYHDIFPVWNWMKVPGTTVRITPSLEGGVRFKGTRAFAGGVSDGRYGCAAFDMERSGLIARKSWFFFDDEVVCLGAGIGCAKTDTVVTTLNQCFLRGDVNVSRMGKRTTVQKGSHGLDGVEWISHDGIVYLFPGHANVRLSNMPQTGTWWDINHTHSKDAVTRDVFTLWLDHGMSPSNARYAYIIAPNLAPADVGKYHADPPVEILSNEPAIQAVRHKKLGITGIVFYEKGRVAVGNNLAVEADTACMLLVRENSGGMEISASNPANEGLRLTVRAGDPSRLASFQPVVFDLPDGPRAGMSLTKTVKR